MLGEQVRVRDSDPPLWERRRRRVRRFLVGSFSLFMIGSIMFVTWAWSNEPEMLGAQLNDSIEEFRILFI